MSLESWLASNTTPFPQPEVPGAVAGTSVVFLGETNHFIREKTDFRLGWLNAILETGPVVIAEELGWADGRRVADFIFNRNDAALDHAATFGFEGYVRDDRDDRPQGIFKSQGYPHASMKQEHKRLYSAIRDHGNLKGFFGIDVDAPGAGYADTDLKPLAGEILQEEIARLRKATRSPDVAALIDALHYAALIRDVEDYEASRPAMAFREAAMKRRLDTVLAQVQPGTTLVVMGHAFHLAKNDGHIEKAGVGPGGDEVSSIGHYLCQEKGCEAASIWMLYGEGEDSQPLPDLPRVANYSSGTVNKKLAQYLQAPVWFETKDLPNDLGRARVGHLYNLEVEVQLREEADVVTFFPTVSPLPISE